MSFIKMMEKLRLMDNLIKKKATGNQEEFARKIGVCRSMLNVYLSEMKVMGFPIQYSRSRSSYYYEGEGELVSNLFQQPMSKEEMKEAIGGIRPIYDSVFMTER